ncbi:protein tyrosine phosphatase family protein [Nostocales cyanobacterium LEGE 11386]|nr:protein tyrosine phosphatase family protein [Nostocales cyanobacterium LEGE 11386]
MSSKYLEEINNFLNISDVIATAGQPTPAQLVRIRESGFQVFINLALSTSDNALPDEQEIVEFQSMEYIHIPVVWEQPSLENVTEFFRVMAANTNKKIFVHCAANKRVSAFIYLYRRLHEGINDEDAKKDLHQIWIPNKTWKKFIQEVLEIYPQIKKNYLQQSENYL